jgi:hypothetical protein
MLVIKDTAEVVLLYYDCMHGTSPEAFTAVDAAIFNQPCLAVTDAQCLCGTASHAEGAAGAYILADGQCVMKKSFFHSLSQQRCSD